MSVNPIERLDLTAEQVETEADRLWAERDRRVAVLHARKLERQIAEIRARILAAHPDPDGAHWDLIHEFLEIDPDLRGRDYTGGTSR